MSKRRKLTPSFSAEKAHQTQVFLSRKIVKEDRLPLKIRTVAGVDVAYVGDVGVGAIVVLDYDSLTLMESKTAICQVKIPYIPTLLSFREIPPAVAAFKKLEIQPDVVLVDAQGVAHPYRCGFASHLGLVLGLPTVGVAKSRLIGTEVEMSGGTFLVDKSEVIGKVVATKPNVKPIYVSVGNMISLETAVKIVLHCSKSRIPEPLRLAHKLATEERIRLVNEAK